MWFDGEAATESGDFAVFAPLYIVFGMLSLLGGLAVALVLLRTPAIQRDHASRLILIITLVDVAFTLKYVVSAAAWEAGHTDPRRSFHLFADNCLSSAAYGQFFAMACVSWNFVWIFDFVCVLFNPLRNTASNRRFYHVFVWLVSAASTAYVIGMGVNSDGQDHICWLKGDSTNTWVFEIPLYLFLSLGVFSLIFAFFRLRQGSALTLRSRRRLLFRHSLYIIAFIVLWLWPVTHHFFDADNNIFFLSLIDVLVVSGQGFIFACIRISEPGAWLLFKQLVRAACDCVMRPFCYVCCCGRLWTGRCCRLRCRRFGTGSYSKFADMDGAGPGGTEGDALAFVSGFGHSVSSGSLVAAAAGGAAGPGPAVWRAGTPHSMLPHSDDARSRGNLTSPDGASRPLLHDHSHVVSSSGGRYKNPILAAARNASFASPPTHSPPSPTPAAPSGAAPGSGSDSASGAGGGGIVISAAKYKIRRTPAEAPPRPELSDPWAYQTLSDGEAAEHPAVLAAAGGQVAPLSADAGGTPLGSSVTSQTSLRLLLSARQHSASKSAEFISPDGSHAAPSATSSSLSSSAASAAAASLAGAALSRITAPFAQFGPPDRSISLPLLVASSQPAPPLAFHPLVSPPSEAPSEAPPGAASSSVGGSSRAGDTAASSVSVAVSLRYGSRSQAGGTASNNGAAADTPAAEEPLFHEAISMAVGRNGRGGAQARAPGSLAEPLLPVAGISRQMSAPGLPRHHPSPLGGVHARDRSASERAVAAPAHGFAPSTEHAAAAPRCSPLAPFGAGTAGGPASPSALSAQTPAPARDQAGNAQFDLQEVLLRMRTDDARAGGSAVGPQPAAAPANTSGSAIPISDSASLPSLASKPLSPSSSSFSLSDLAQHGAGGPGSVGRASPQPATPHARTTHPPPLSGAPAQRASAGVGAGWDIGYALRLEEALCMLSGLCQAVLQSDARHAARERALRCGLSVPQARCPSLVSDAVAAHAAGATAADAGDPSSPSATGGTATPTGQVTGKLDAQSLSRDPSSQNFHLQVLEAIDCSHYYSTAYEEEAAKLGLPAPGARGPSAAADIRSPLSPHSTAPVPPSPVPSTVAGSDRDVSPVDASALPGVARSDISAALQPAMGEAVPTAAAPAASPPPLQVHVPANRRYGARKPPASAPIPQPAHGFDLVSFADAEFANLRAAAALRGSQVVYSLDPYLLRSGALRAHFSEGASASFFCRSLDQQLVVKTISEQELRELVRLLPAYSRYMLENPDTLLCRFYGCFSLKLPSSSRVCFLLMGNVFPVVEAGAAAETFDLKGSTVGRRARVSKSLVSQKGKPGGTLQQDAEFRELYPHGLPVADIPADERMLPPLPSCSSGGGPRTLWPRDMVLGCERSEGIVHQLMKDTALLACHGLMDYSLLVSIMPVADYDPFSFSVPPATVPAEVPLAGAASLESATAPSRAGAGGERPALLRAVLRPVPGTKDGTCSWELESAGDSEASLSIRDACRLLESMGFSSLYGHSSGGAAECEKLEPAGGVTFNEAGLTGPSANNSAGDPAAAVVASRHRLNSEFHFTDAVVDNDALVAPAAAARAQRFDAQALTQSGGGPSATHGASSSHLSPSDVEGDDDNSEVAVAFKLSLNGAATLALRECAQLTHAAATFPRQLASYGSAPRGFVSQSVVSEAHPIARMTRWSPLAVSLCALGRPRAPAALSQRAQADGLPRPHPSSSDVGPAGTPRAAPLSTERSKVRVWRSLGNSSGIDPIPVPGTADEMARSLELTGGRETSEVKGADECGSSASGVAVVPTAVPSSQLPPSTRLQHPLTYQGRALLQIGIVDVLQSYDVGKRVENTFKTLRHAVAHATLASADISSVAPDAYASRFTNFVTQIFSPLPGLAASSAVDLPTLSLAAGHSAGSSALRH